jgi:hypothetical protein
LSHRLAAAVGVLYGFEDVSDDTLRQLRAVFAETDAEELSDFPEWVRELVARAEAPVA